MPKFTRLELGQIEELVQQEIEQTSAKMNGRGKRRPVVVMGEEVPEWRLRDLRWQKMLFLAGIRNKCRDQ